MIDWAVVATVAGILLAVITIPIGIYLMIKYQYSKIMKEGMENYKIALEANKSLLDIRLKEIETLFAKMDSLKLEIQASEISHTKQIAVLEERIKLLESELSSYRASKIQEELKVGELKRLAIWIKRNCPQQCELAKTVQEKINEVVDEC